MRETMGRRRFGALGRAALAFLAAGASPGRAASAQGDGSLGRGEMAPPAGQRLGGRFALVDHRERTATDEDFRGAWTLFSFGYTSCPDVCPTALQTMAAALETLEADLAARLQPVFVTLDPERDTPERLAAYVALFDPRLLGLTGTPAQVAAAARAFRVHYARSRTEGAAGYLLDHSSFLYLADPAGEVRALFRAGIASDDLAAALRRRLA